MARLELPLDIDQIIPARMLAALRPASVLVPVIRRPAGLQVLLTQRAETLRSHKGQISFPGGRRDEEDASAAAAALREAEEEVGLPRSAVEVIGYLDDYPTLTKYMVTPVVGYVMQAPPLTPHVHEVAEVFEVPLEFLLDLASFEKKKLTRRGLNVPFFEINYGKWRIWGATAGMLWNLAQKMDVKAA